MNARTNDGTLEQAKEEKQMETFEQTTQKEVRRPSLLLDVRNYQCSFVRSPDEKGSDPFGRGISNGGNSLHNAGGRLEGMPSADRGTGARDELSGSDGSDSVTDADLVFGNDWQQK